MGENDYNAGYRGDQFHHGMDRDAYERGKADKEFIASIGKGGPPVEINGVSFTLLMIAPMIWMIYPALGFTLWAVAVGCYFLFTALHVPMHWGFILGFILCVMSFLLGIVLEQKASQAVVYRWFRGLVRIGAPLLFVFVGLSGDSPSDFQFFIKEVEPVALVVGFFIAVIAYLIYQRLDLIYFPAMKEIKKIQEQLNKGERPQRSMGKRLFYGFCWFIPVMVVLTLALGLVLMQFMTEASQREDFTKQYGIIFGSINCAIWYLLCLLGILPGTGKYSFSKAREEGLLDVQGPAEI